MKKKEENSLKENIIEQIKKSGFPLEINSSIILNKNNWLVESHSYYFDRKIDDWKETDIVAEKCSNKNNNFKYLLVIECKKSESKPWVFFKQKWKKEDRTLFNVASYNIEKIREDLNNFTKKHHYLTEPLHSYYLTPFVKKDDGKLDEKNDIYKAISQILNSLEFYFKKELSSEQLKKDNKSATLIFPVIVFDGDLFSAEVENEKIELNGKNHVLLQITKEFKQPRAHGRNSDLKFNKFVIDIIKKEYFDDYLKKFD